MHLDPVFHDAWCSEGNVGVPGLVLGDLCLGGERGEVIPSETTESPPGKGAGHEVTALFVFFF